MIRRAIGGFAAGLFCLLVSGVISDARAAMPSADVLLDRAQRLADTAEIKRLQAIYGYYLDRSDWDAVLDIFTDDVEAEYGAGGVYRGKAQAKALLYGIGYGKPGLRPGQLREHVQLQPVVTLGADGMTAKGRWKALVLLGQYGDYARWQSGPYENEYRKENGRWKISRIHWFEDFTVPYEGAWTKAMSQSNVADRKFPPPDASSSFAGSTQVWPAVTLAPFHYSNPVVTKPAIATPVKAKVGDEGQKLAQAKQLMGLVRDEQQIQVLQRTYGFLVDKNLWNQIGDLFTEDSTLEIGGRGVFVGKARVLQYLKWLGNPEHGKLYDHTQMQPVVSVAPDGQTAKGRWRALIFGADQEKGVDFLGDCIYENEYRKENGVWKITKLHAYFVLYTDFSRGWGVTFWALTAPELDMPPDRKPTGRYEIYPGNTFVPYHYANPVSGARPSLPSVVAVPKREAGAERARLDNQITRLEDVDSIENLQNAYGFYREKWQWDDAANLFAASGTRETAQRGVYVGRDSVRRSFDVEGPAGVRQGQIAQHYLYQHVIHVGDDGHSAKARLRELTFAGGFGGKAEVGGEVAENRFVKENGVWKFQSEHQYTTFWADYAKGWSKGAMPAAGPSKDIPADRPPSEKYEAFPAYYIPPFHYGNPVTGKPIP